MPDTACLHIQGRDSDPVRVVELPGVSVRIGRASYCEVRLPEAELAEEECHLRRRGSTWHLVPVASPCSVTIDGHAVEHARPLPYGVPLRVGEHSLTLRPAGASPPEWGHAQAPVAVAVPTVHALVPDVLRPAPSRELVMASADPAARRARREGLLRASQEERKWEARWKAAGEKLRATAPAAAPPRPSPPESPRVTPRPEGWGSAEPPRREPGPALAQSAPRRDATGFPSVKALATPPRYPTAAPVDPPRPAAAGVAASPPRYPAARRWNHRPHACPLRRTRVAQGVGHPPDGPPSAHHRARDARRARSSGLRSAYPRSCRIAARTSPAHTGRRALDAPRGGRTRALGTYPGFRPPGTNSAEQSGSRSERGRIGPSRAGFRDSRC